MHDTGWPCLMSEPVKLGIVAFIGEGEDDARVTGHARVWGLLIAGHPVEAV